MLNGREMTNKVHIYQKDGESKTGQSGYLNIEFELKYKLNELPVESLELCNRTKHALLRSKINSLAQLIKLGDTELRSIEGIGVRGVEEIKTKLNKFLGTENYYCIKESDFIKKFNEELIFYIEYLLGITEYQPEQTDFNYFEYIYIERCREAIEFFGKDIFNKAYTEPDKSLAVMNALVSFANCYENRKETVLMLKKAYDKIHKNNLNADIKSFCHIYINNEDEINGFMSILNLLINRKDGDIKPYKVREIEKVTNSSDFNYEYAERIVSFINNLNKDINDVIENIYQKIYHSKRQMMILQKRVNGETLESIGSEYNISRERVRQIEAAVQKQFDVYADKIKLVYYISALNEGVTIISRKELEEIFDDNYSDIVYMLMHSKCEHFIYASELDIFTLDVETKFSDLKDTIFKLPNIIYEEQLPYIVIETSQKYNIDQHLLYKGIKHYYKLCGKVYCRGKNTLTEMYQLVLMTYYPEGLKLYDPVQINQFTKKTKDIFGNVSIPVGIRAIDARIADIAVLCDRGTYIHPSYIQIDQALIIKIDNYIENSERSTLSYIELFETFYNELIKYSNINNRYFLQGAIKYFLKDKYILTKEYVLKDKDSTIEADITDYVKRNKCVTIQEIKKSFAGVHSTMLMQIMSRCTEVITIDNARYIHSSMLNIIKEDMEIRQFLKKIIQKRPVSSRKLLLSIQKIYSAFTERNQIDNYIKLYYILQYMFRNDFKFSRPYISKKVQGEVTNIYIVKQYIKELTYVKISDLINFCSENHILFLSWSIMLSQLEEEFIRADSDLLLNNEEINIDDKKLEIISYKLKDLIQEKRYIPARKVIDFRGFPDIGVTWTSWLLKSIAKKYLGNNVVVVDVPTTDIYNLSCIYADPDLGFEDYEILIKWIVETESKKGRMFNNLTDIKRWMTSTGIICLNLPRFMQQTNITINEDGSVSFLTESDIS